MTTASTVLSLKTKDILTTKSYLFVDKESLKYFLNTSLKLQNNTSKLWYFSFEKGNREVTVDEIVDGALSVSVVNEDNSFELSVEYVPVYKI